MRQIHIGPHTETVIERADYPPERVREILQSECLAVLGYGVLGRALALNLRDRGLNVVVGLRAGGPSRNAAEQDGWQPGVSLLFLKDAGERGTVILNLLSDAGQREQWPSLLPLLTAGKALLFAHGFGVVYADQTGMVPPADIDVLLVSPRGSGTTLRRLAVEGKFMNASFAVKQDATRRARDRCLACGVAAGFGFLFETTFEKETFGDLTGERGSLLGAIYGMWLAQYEVLREHGHSPAESFLETVEEATQSLYPLIAEKGMDWMYANASATAQRGALDWYLRFRDVLKPVMSELYAKVRSGAETQRVLEANGQPDYRRQLEAELRKIGDSEMWQTGQAVRSLRTDGDAGNR